MNRRLRLTPILPYTLAAVLSTLALILVLRLWRADLHVPLAYFGDAIYYSALIKTMTETGWILHNDRLGMPLGSDFHDFPSADIFNIFLLKLLSYLIHDPIILFNLFYLATYPLAAISSLFVLKRFGISNATAICLSILYAFIPFHFLSGCGHMFLSSYYMVPLAVMIALWIAMGEGARVGLRNRKAIFSIVFCLILGTSGIFYYPLFACFFLLIAGISAAISSKNLRPLLTAAALILLVLTSLTISLLPQIAYLKRNGDVRAARRTAVEAEIYGLKIAQMILPVTGHRISKLAELKRKYNAAPLSQENDFASIGTASTIGFLFLIGWGLFFRLNSTERKFQVIDKLGLFNLAAVLLATVGGFGSLFALLISPQIRVYHRICVFIAFFSLFALALFIEMHAKPRFFSKKKNLIFHAFLITITILGLLDQTTDGFIPTYEQDQREERSYRAFINEIERRMPVHAMIFQLPYMPFPGSPPINQMQDSDHFKAYLLSRTLRWSYGAIKDRPADLWQRQVVTLPVERFIEELCVAGFSGILINRTGYADHGAAIEAQLSSFLGPPLASDDDKLSFFSLLDYKTKLKRQIPDVLWQKREDSILHPIKLIWEDGFSNLEGTPENNWRWCSSQGRLQIRNDQPRAREIVIEMELSTGYGEASDIWINGLSLNDHLRINADETRYARRIVVPPGTHYLEFSCNAPLVRAPRDARDLVFKASNFKLTEVVQ
jgi:phosphoglycerol transferase